MQLKTAWLVFLSGLFLFALGLAIGPRVPAEDQIKHCVVNVDLPGPFGIGLNCDSPEFLRLAEHPSSLLEPQNTRQSRPGWILIASAVAAPFAPLNSLILSTVQGAARADIDPARINNSLRNGGAYYIAYILLNFSVLIASFYFLVRVVCPNDRIDEWTLPTKILLGACGLLLVGNDVVKAFLFSPHNQMLNIFVPVASVYVARRSWLGQLHRRPFLVAWSLICGIGITIYPVFIVLFGAMIVPAFARIFWAKHKDQWRIVISQTAIATCATIAPMLIWFLYVFTQTGTFYQHEVALGQVVWIHKAAQQSPFEAVTILLSNFSSLLMRAVRQSTGLAFALALIAVFMSAQRHIKLDADRIRAVFFASALLF
jgi:hypothetical protein